MDRSLYPPDWEERSRYYRFEIAGGQCEKCGVRHGKVVAKGPDLNSEYPATRIAWWWLNTAHRDRNPANNDYSNYIALCPRCHALYDMDDILQKREYGYHHAGAHQYKIDFDSSTPADESANSPVADTTGL